MNYYEAIYSRPLLLFVGLFLIGLGSLSLFISFEKGENLIIAIIVILMGVSDFYLVKNKERYCKWIERRKMKLKNNEKKDGG